MFPADEPLRGTQWQIVSFEGHNDAAREAQSTIVFEPDTTTFGGKAACNSYYGTYQLEEDSDAISLDVEAITEIACDLGSYESDLLETLEHITSYKITGDNLTLRGADGKEKLEFGATAD